MFIKTLEGYQAIDEISEFWLMPISENENSDWMVVASLKKVAGHEQDGTPISASVDVARLCCQHHAQVYLDQLVRNIVRHDPLANINAYADDPPDALQQAN